MNIVGGLFVSAMFSFLPILVNADVTNMLERNLSPGALTTPHAELENNCKNCHRLFDKDAENQLCSECHDHKNIAEDIQNKTGFHGRSPNVEGKKCRSCHSEHHGRDHPLVILDTKQFDHQDTDFTLDRRHQGVKCEKCHVESSKYFQAKHLCVDCHVKKDAHDGKLGKQCGDCHDGLRWKDYTFDHSKTKFKLVGKHRETKCKECHANNKYKYRKMQCDTCHREDDKHKQKLGTECGKCHQASSWKKIRFNHNKTDYILRKSHQKTKCLSCHSRNPYNTNTSTQCYACHRKKDEHKGIFGKKCDDCHDEGRWKKSFFDHDDTAFVLSGEHIESSCHDCHRLNQSPVPEKASCIDCHDDVDVHKNALGERCESCHRPSSWIDTPDFDHNLTRFPIKGEHRDALCDECHFDQRYKDVARKCYGCHEDATSHFGLFGEECEDCHTVVGWMAWRFSHDQQTDFALKGKHRQLSCFDCHTTASTATLDDRCYSCHLLDDVHNGSFGQDCERCHSQKRFTGARVR